MKFDSYKGGTLQKVIELENKLGIIFPNDYRDFLINENGADIYDACFYVQDLKQDFLMGNLFGIDIQEGLADIEKVYQEYGENLPENCVFIGTDAGNRFIILVAEEESKGIWLYDDSYSIEQSSDEENTYFICETFTEFLKMLEKTKPE